MSADILLIGINARYMHPAFALRCLKANLRALEGACEIKEYTLESPIEGIISDIQSSEARILGIGVYVWNHGYIARLLEAVRARSGPVPSIILGGPEVSYLPVDAPIIRFADVVVRGEGETIFAKLCEEILDGAKLLPGWTKDSTAFSVEGGRINLASLKAPYYLYTDVDLAHRRFVYVESGRGCPFACEFCLSSIDTGMRYFDVDGFLSEMRELIRRGARRIKFLDRTFNADIDRAVKIAEYFLEELPEDGFVHFELVPELLPRELKDVLSKFPAGKLRLEMGIQTFNPEVARRVGRFQDMDAAMENLVWLKDHTKAILHVDLLAGLPGEDMESFGKGFDRLWSARPGEIQLGLLKKLPGAPIARHDEPWEMHYRSEPPYCIVSNKSMSAAETGELARFARFWELVINRGKFKDYLPKLLPEGRSAFASFRGFCAAAFARLGKTHGIDQDVLGEFIRSYN